jgi:hypothetical protein
MQRKVWIQAAVVQATPAGEQMPAQAGACGGRQKPGGNDLIGVDVRVRQDDRARTNQAKGLHG